MFIETKKIKATKDLENDLIEVEYEDDPNKDIFNKNVFDSIKTEEENTDLQCARNKRCEPLIKEVLEVCKKYNVRYSDTRFLFDRVNLSMLDQLLRADAKTIGYTVKGNEDPSIVLDRRTMRHIQDILEK